MKHNRVRNIFTILAIVLTTFMFTAVFSIGFSLAKNMNVMMLRQQGNKATIYLNNPTSEQKEQIKKAKHINAVGMAMHVKKGKVENKDSVYALDYFDKTQFEENYLPAVSDLVGHYPEQEDEIMVSRAGLEALGIDNPEEKMKVSLLIDDKEQFFTLSGWFTDYGFADGGFQAFVSEEYVSSLDLSVEKDAKLAISAKVGTQSQLLDELEKEVTLNDGQEFDTTFDVQSGNISNNILVAIMVLLVGFIIVFSGYLLIYNIMYISVTKDIRFYGMLKTIGTTPSQIQNIVKKQAFRLSVIGIPIGTLIGTLSAFGVVPYALVMFQSGENSAMPTTINFNPFIYLGTILFGIITVSISCRKPAKLAGRVSPIEAMKYNGISQVKCKAKKTTDGGKLHKMAYRNVFRDKKRSLLVFASLFMGTMAFLSANTFLGSVKVENYVDMYLPNDYTIYTNSSQPGEQVDSDDEKTAFNAAKKLISDIEAIDGVNEVSYSRSVNGEITFDENIFRPFIENSVNDSKEEAENLIAFFKKNANTAQAYASPVIGVSTEMIERYNERAKQKIDIERFEKGEVCFMGYVKSDEQSKEMVGKTFTVTDRISKNSIDLEIAACPTSEDDWGINIGNYWIMGGSPDCILVSQNVINQLTDTPSIDNIVVNCEPDVESLVTTRIKQLTKTSPCVEDVEIKSDMILQFKTSMGAMNILSSGISLILILIGIINFINVMLTGVFTRRRELAVMESVGMTKKQIQKMLMLEGVFYGGITIGLILTIGNVIIYFVAKMTKQIVNYAVFQYPFGLMIIISFIIILICIIVPAVVYKMVAKETVTDRLSIQE